MELDSVDKIETFLLRILEGKYAADIMRPGSIQFIKNQLCISNANYTKQKLLRLAISEISKNTLFDAETALDNSFYFTELASWITEFTPNNVIEVQKLLTLSDRLVNYYNPENLNNSTFTDLLYKINLCIFKILRYHIHNDYSSQNPILKLFKSSEGLFLNWSRFLNFDSTELVSLGCLGLIYLSKWTYVDVEFTSSFWVKMSESENVKSQVFYEIIEDMASTPSECRVDYTYFADDCKIQNNDFYQLISEDAPQWLHTIPAEKAEDFIQELYISYKKESSAELPSKQFTEVPKISDQGY